MTKNEAPVDVVVVSVSCVVNESSRSESSYSERYTHTTDTQWFLTYMHAMLYAPPKGVPMRSNAPGDALTAAS